MINKKTFNEIVKGNADQETVKQYYKEIVDLASKIDDDHPDAGKIADQITFLEDLYKLKESPTKEDNTALDELFDFPGISEEIKSHVDTLIDLDYAPAGTLPIIDYLSKTLKLPHSTNLAGYYYARKDQREQEDFRSEINKDLSEALDLNKLDINISDYLPDWMGPAISHYCKTANVKHLLVMLGILSGVSVCQKVKTRLMVDPSKDWREPASLFVLIMSPTGQGKTPFLEKIVTGPLSVIQQEYKETYLNDVIDYELQLEEAKTLPKEQKAEALKALKRIPDRERIIFTTDPTIIGLNQQFNAYPDQGILGIFDEGSKLFAFDRTGSGKSDRADLLTLYNGNGIHEVRLAGSRANVQRVLLSIIAGIQPRILLEMMGDCEDNTGQWARFLYAVQPKARKLPSRHCPPVDVKDFLTATYRQIMQLPETLYELDKQAGLLFDDYYYLDIENSRMRASKLGLEAVFGKSGGQVARIALNLHVLEIIQGTKDPKYIRDETVEKAIALYRVCLSQIKGLYTIAEAGRGELPPKLALIIERSKQVGPVTARDIKQYVWCCKKDDPSKIREWFRQLEKMGKGEVFGFNNRQTFTAYK